MSSASSKKWLKSCAIGSGSDKELDLAAQMERRNWAAVRLGLPPIGSLMSNKYGIEWLVQGHLQVPTIESLHRWRTGNIEPRLDMYPAISPQNLSPRFLEFFAAIDRCTTKAFLSLDTMPGRRKDGHVPGHNYIDTLCHRDTNFLFLDAGRIHETIIAHEMGHAWVQYVDQCEDLRTMEDASHPQRMHQVAFVQSFVLDLKVNDLIRRKGFDMSPIEQDKAATMAQLAAGLSKGIRPESRREEAFLALLVADEILERDLGRSNELAKFDDSLASIKTHAAGLASLAESFADSVRRTGYDNRAAIVRCIDECLTASFEHVGEAFDNDRELVAINPPEPDLSKFPNWLPMLAPKVKCDVGRHMAKNDITDEWGQSIEPTVTGRARVTFRSPERDRRSDVLLGAHIGRPTRYAHTPELHAELMAMKHRNQTGDWQIHGGPPHPSNPPMGYDPRPHNGARSSFLEPRIRGPFQRCYPAPAPPIADFRPDAAEPGHRPLRPGRPYMAGLGRFLTAARLADQMAGEHPYSYALNNPIIYTDPMGLSVNAGSPPGVRGKYALQNDCGAIFQLVNGNTDVASSFNDCVESAGCKHLSRQLVLCMFKLCSGGVSVTVSTNASDPGCVGNCGYSIPSQNTIVLCSNQCGTTGCDHFGTGAPYHLVLIHELLHTCGVNHPEGVPPEAKCNNIMACCLLKSSGLLPPSTQCRP